MFKLRGPWFKSQSVLFFYPVAFVVPKCALVAPIPQHLFTFAHLTSVPDFLFNDSTYRWYLHIAKSLQPQLLERRQWQYWLFDSVHLVFVCAVDLVFAEALG